jgi:hypothetical protein
MIDVNKITSTLAKLPDQQLQQYAQMHKSDPYIMALAMSESNRRKEMRAAGQGGQGMQEQPKVVDQMVAEMAPQQLPEDQGIGQLPAGEMNFAGGGIIAFADGGDVERYSGEFGSFVDGIDPLTGTFYMPDAPPDPASMRRVRTSPYVAPQQTAEEAALLQRFPKTPAKPKVAAAPAADTGRKAPGAAPIAAAAPATGPTDIDALQQKYFGAIDQEVGGLRTARAGLVAGIKDLTEKNLAATEADIAARGDVFKGREERLATREKGIEGMGDKYMGLALLQAGAAMMSTPGALGAALGKGIQVGSERYVAGLDKINAAKDRFADARDRLDDLRINRDDMNARDIRAAKKEAREAELKGQELLYNGLVSDLGIKQKNVAAIFGAAADDLKTTRQIDAERANTLTREGGANARAAMPSGEMRTAMMLGTGKTDAERLESGMQKLQAITADKSGMAAVKVLADINAKLPPGEQRVTMQDLLIGAREFSSLMYGPKVADVAPTRDRPR